MRRRARRRLTTSAAIVAVALGVVVLAGGTLVLWGDQTAGGARHDPAAQRVEPRTVLRHRPNIVVILVDDMRDDDLRFMPHTRRLIGAQGVRFVNSFSPYPLCCPARASMLTGQYAHNHRVLAVDPPYGFRSFDDRSTLATWLHHAGYSTVYLGKYLNGYGWMPEPGRRDGDSVRYVPPGWDRWLASIDGGLSPRDPLAGSTYHYFDTTISLHGKGFRNFVGRYQTDVYAELSERIIARRAAAERPYFFHASYTAPHDGWPREPDDPPPLLRNDGRTTTFNTTARPPRVRGSFDQRVTTAPGLSWRDPDFSDKPRYLRERPPMNAQERAALLEMTRQRAEALSVLDQAVARTMRAVEESGEADDTVVLFTSDNGFFLGEQRKRQGKIWPHEPSLRVPLLLRGPGIPPGERRTDPITSIDLAPTLAELAGITPGGDVDGVSLAQVAREGDRGWNRPVLVQTGPVLESRRLRFILGLRTPRYLYVDIAWGGRELYDLRRDPNQYHNLAGRPAYADVQRQLASTLARVRDCEGAECTAPLPPSLTAD
jgi:N-acetylglucosamine-6-sulfatase